MERAKKEMRLQLELELHRLADRDEHVRPRQVRAWRALLVLGEQPDGTPGHAIANYMLNLMAIELSTFGGNFADCKTPWEYAEFVKFVSVDWPPSGHRGGA